MQCKSCMHVGCGQEMSGRESERSGFDGLADDGEYGLSLVNGLKVTGMVLGLW